MLIWGALAFILVTLVLGWFWPRRYNLEFSTSALITIGGALYTGWLISVLLYYVNINITALRVIAVIVLIVGVWLSYKNRSYFGFKPCTYGLFFIGYTIASLIVYVLPPIKKYYFAPRWSAGFLWSDAVSSWNNWAVQLADAVYTPFDNLYPIGWPGIWSVIYRVQDNAMFWFFAKQSMFSIHLCLILIVTSIAMLKKTIPAIFCALFVVSFFVIYNHWPMINGYMDVPVAALIFIASCLIVIWVNQCKENQSDITYLYVAAIFTGLATVTKQPGFVMFGMFATVVVTAAIHRQIRVNSVCILLLIAGLPFAVFCLLYFSHMVPITMSNGEVAAPKVFGLLETLRGIVDARKGETLNSIYAFEKLNSGYVFSVLVIISAFSLRRFRDLQGQVGIILFFSGVAGFFIYADCCAYDTRNGQWLYSIFAAGALNILLNSPRADIFENLLVTRFPWLKFKGPVGLTSPRSSLKLSLYYAGIILSIAATVSFASDSKTIAEWDAKQRWRLSSEEFRDLLSEKIKLTLPSDSDDNWAIVTTYPQYRYLPGFEKFMRICRGKDTKCVEEIVREVKYTYVITTPKDSWHNFTTYVEKLSPKLLLGEALRRNRTPYQIIHNELYGPIQNPYN